MLDRPDNNTQDQVTSRTFRVAISKQRFVGKPDLTQAEWAAFNDGFRNMELTPIRFMDALYKGFAFCPWMDGRRKLENFQSAQHIGIDMDTGDKRSSIDELLQHPLVRYHGAIVYSTPSSTEQEPRSRIVFILDEPIDNPEGYKLALKAFTSMFGGADPACADPVRFFYGNGALHRDGATEHIRFSEHYHFPLDELRNYYRMWVANTSRPEPAQERRPGWSKSSGDFDPVRFVEANLVNGRSGNRNRLGYWMAKIMQEEGISMVDAERHMLWYQQRVTSPGDPYSEQEALATLRSAYR